MNKNISFVCVWGLFVFKLGCKVRRSLMQVRGAGAQCARLTIGHAPYTAGAVAVV